MRIRIRGSRCDDRFSAALARRARFTLGRHQASVEHVEIAFAREESPTVAHEVCRVTVRLRGGVEVLVSDDGRHPGRALLRAAWRIEQLLALRRLSDWRPNGGSPASRVS